MKKTLHKILYKIDENSKNIIVNILATIFIKGGALVVSLLTTPSFIRYFNNAEILGLWFTMLSVLSWILTFDLGIGNGLRNELVKPLVEENILEVKKVISSAYVSVGIVVAFFLGIFLYIYDKVNWNLFFNISVTSISAQTLEITVLIIVLGILMQFFLKLITSIFYALQKPAINNLLPLMNSIVILLYVNIFKFNNVEESLLNLALVYALSVNLPLMIATIFVFKTELKNNKPSFKFYSRKTAKQILKIGGIFLWVQVMYMILNGTNEFLITWLVEPEAVVEFQIYNRIFLTLGSIFTIGLTPIWSAVTKSLAQNNFIWIRKIFYLLSKISIVAVIMTLLLVPNLQYIFNIWLGSESIEANYLTAIIFAIMACINIWNSVLSTIANGLGKLRPQAILFTLAVIIKIGLSPVLVNHFNSWVGILIANVIAMIPYCILQPIFINRIINKKNK